MIKTKKVFKKLLISLLIIITLFNFISSIGSVNDVFATDISSVQTEKDKSVGGPLSFIGGAIGDAIDGVINGIVGMLLNFVKTIIVSPIRMLRDLNYTLASAGGKVKEKTTSTGTVEMTPYDVFFNKFALLDANIFSTKMSDGTNLDKDGIVYKIRTNTSIWYYAIRTVAIFAVAIMLLWNLMKSLSKSSSAGQKVIAKNALMDWVLSFALIMFMHIIIILIFNINEQLLNVISKLTTGPNLGNFVDSLESVIFADNLTLSIAAIAVYAILEWQTFKYIFIYVQRLLTIVLLVLISPLVPVTYSTDRMKGGRGLALNNWLKELVYNVFIQSIHALIYCAMVGVPLGMFNDSSTVKTTGDLGIAFIAIAGLLFMKYAERIVKTVFGFNNSQILNTNIFSDVSSVAIGAGKAVGRGIQRAATGGPLVSFGQNVDGSHIGIGQVASGLGNSARRTADGVRDFAGNMIAGAGNAAEHVRDYAGQVREKGSEWLDSVEERGGIVEVGKDRARDAVDRAKEKASDVKAGAVNVFTKLSGRNSGNKDEQEKRGKLDDTIEQLKKEQEERDKEKAKEQAQGQNQESDNNTTVVNVVNSEETEETKKSNKIEENEEKSIKTKTSDVEEVEIEEKGEDKNSSKNGNEPIVVGMGANANPELLRKFKEELKAILNDDKETLNKWADEAQKKWDEAKKKIDSKEEEKILNFFSKNWKDKGMIQDYINSFKEGSAEREYADALSDVFTFVDIDDENMLSKEDKIKSLVDSYNAKGLEIPPTMVTKMTDSSEVDRLVSEKEEKEPPKAIQEESSTAPVLEAIQNDDLVKTISALGTLGLKLGNNIKVEGRAEGSIETEVEDKIQADFESRTQEMAAKYKLDPKSMKLDEIKDKMSKQAQEELQKYDAKQIDENDLSDEAKSFAILEKEAKYLGFKVEKGSSSVSGRTTIESKFEDGTVKEVTGDTFEEATKSTIVNLADKRAEIEARRNGEINRRKRG